MSDTAGAPAPAEPQPLTTGTDMTCPTYAVLLAAMRQDQEKRLRDAMVIRPR